MTGIHPLALLGVLLAGRPVTAPVELELEWDAPPSCPGADEVRAQIGALLPREVVAPVQLSVRAVVHEAGARYELELAMVLASAHGSRRVSSGDCHDLARATALVVATMVDPIAVADRLEAAASASAPAPAVVEPPVAMADETFATSPDPALAVIAEPPARGRRRAPVWPVASLRIEGLAGSAALPRVDAGLGLSAGVIVSHARIDLGAAHLFAQSRAHPSVRDVELRVRGTMGMVRACGVPAFGAWELPLCGGAEVGALSAQGEGDAVSAARLVRSPYAAAFVEADATWRATPRIALFIGVQGLVALARPRFTVGDLDPFVRTAWGGGRAKLGLEVRFP